MKNLSIYIMLLAISVVSFQACGPSEEEKRAAEQARLDSLRQVEQQRIAALTEAREDSLALVAERERKEKEEEANAIKFTDGGEYALQVGAWRSEEKANRYKEMWNNREYPSIYIVKIGDEEDGSLWYRVRIGFFGSKEDAEKLGREISNEINSGYWVSKVERSS